MLGEDDDDNNKEEEEEEEGERGFGEDEEGGTEESSEAAGQDSLICWIKDLSGSFMEKRASKKDDSEDISWGISRSRTIRSAVSSVAMISFSFILRSVNTTAKSTSNPSMKNRSRTLK